MDRLKTESTAHYQERKLEQLLYFKTFVDQIKPDFVLLQHVDFLTHAFDWRRWDILPKLWKVALFSIGYDLVTN